MFDGVGLVELSGKAAGDDARLCSDDELFAGVLAIERARALLDAAEAHVVAEIDARGASESAWGMTTVAWLAREAIVSRRTAKARVQVGVSLRARLGETDAALMAGRI